MHYTLPQPPSPSQYNSHQGEYSPRLFDNSLSRSLALPLPFLLLSRTSAPKPNGGRPDIAVATRSTRFSTSTTVAMAAAAAPAATSAATAAAVAAAGTAMVVPFPATPAMPPAEAGAAAAPMPAAAEIAAGGAAAMAAEAATAPLIASNNLPFADVIFIDDAKWRDKYLGGVFQPPVRRAAAKAMSKISEISVAAATAPASPRRKSTGISGGGKFGAAPRGATGAFGFAPSSGVESQRRHSISGSGSDGGGGGGGVDHTGAIVPQKRPGSPIMQGERFTRHECWSNGWRASFHARVGNVPFRS